MRELQEFVQGLNANQLVSLRNHVANGSATELINSQLEADSMMVCPVCERAVDERKDIVLTFGPEGLRQKARFCGHDCLEYFLERRRVDSQSLNKIQENED